jgi:putative oxidoreductase
MKKKILSTTYSDTAFNFALLLLRLVFGLTLCLHYGVSKLTSFSEYENNFFDPFHIGHRFSLVLAITAEVFGSMLLILGLFTRIAAFVLVFEMCIIIFMYKHSQPFNFHENAVLFLIGFSVILLVGPGRISVDAMAGK